MSYLTQLRKSGLRPESGRVSSRQNSWSIRHLNRPYQNTFERTIIANCKLGFTKDGWYRPPRRLILPMAIVHHNTGKVRPVMDYHELNNHMEAYTAHADVCSQKLRDWRRKGSDMSVLDLRKAYLQVHVYCSLWPFQTMMVKGQRYCLTRMGFGLNVAPSIMRAIVETVLSNDVTVQQATSTYIEDIFINNSMAPAERVKQHFLWIGQESKDLERLEDSTRVLKLEVWGECGTLRCKRGSGIPDVPEVVTHQSIFSLCGKLIRHLPVCRWLWAPTGMIKRRANTVTRGWDDTTEDAPLWQMVRETIARVAQSDPSQGQWCTTE